MNSILLEKLTGPQLVKNPPDFMKPKDSLSRLQELATCPNPDPHEFIPFPIPILEGPF
jgi:hypothetical protein